MKILYQKMLLMSHLKLLASYPLLWCRVQLVSHREVVSLDDVNLVRGLPGKGDVFEDLQYENSGQSSRF